MSEIAAQQGRDAETAAKSGVHSTAKFLIYKEEGGNTYDIQSGRPNSSSGAVCVSRPLAGYGHKLTVKKGDSKAFRRQSYGALNPSPYLRGELDYE